MASFLTVLPRQANNSQLIEKLPPDNFTPAQEELLVVQGVLAGVSALVLGTRFYVRAVWLKAVKLDDWVMLAAQVRETA